MYMRCYISGVPEICFTQTYIHYIILWLTMGWYVVSAQFYLTPQWER